MRAAEPSPSFVLVAGPAAVDGQLGKWLLFDLSSPQSVQQTFADLFGTSLPADVASCVSTTYASHGVQPYFALGLGVAGGNNPNAAAGGVLAHNNPNLSVLGDLRGIDHLETSPVGAALFDSLGACGIDVGEE